MRAWAIICAVCVALVALFLPYGVKDEGVPWRNQFSKQYQAGGYAVFDGGLYAVGRGSQTTSKVANFLSRKTGLFHDGYVFVKCGPEKVRHLSFSREEDTPILERIRFYGPEHPSYARYATHYQRQCWSTLANADRLYRYKNWVKNLFN